MKILVYTSMLGLGSEEGLRKTFIQNIDYIDVGSTIPGPYYLGAGESFSYVCIRR